MDIERGVVSKDLAMQMKEAGYPQYGVFFWILQNRKWSIYFYQDIPLDWTNANDKKIISAQTVAELGEKLPMSIETDDNNTAYLEIQKAGNDWSVRYFQPLVGGGGKCIEGFIDTEANARGEMVLYLVEKGLLKF